VNSNENSVQAPDEFDDELTDEALDRHASGWCGFPSGGGSCCRGEA